ncbi:Uu.00g042640.m01.CDS01 [Anthostomella pinea]|uniref:Carboxylic ester hydrolase n=1 Tax=Anthostomella pinea TaxID=933095 RepID=A0AAI8VAM5_9PEZI|nr:Uu.00g042640.m01.CDS01 [Anthostomella pinea]
MWSLSLFAALLSGICVATADQCVLDVKDNVTYVGISRNGVELFLNIPFGQDTGGANRFKPPRPYTPTPGSFVNAQSYGPACPQERTLADPPFQLSNTTNISENCLNLNVARPNGTSDQDRLPVMLYIFGGGFVSSNPKLGFLFYSGCIHGANETIYLKYQSLTHEVQIEGKNSEKRIAPDGLILESVENGLPVIHVGINYRLGFFGFAQSAALETEGSENAGLRDQRLAIEWVRDHIEHFGGDPNMITIFGQSSGGLAVGMQILAYGADRPVPFQRAICESQALEPGITGNFSIDAMELVVDYVGCNTTDLHSEETIGCLRDFDMETLLNASLATYLGDVAHNIGDIWLPVVDGDFVPAAPSQLIKEGRFGNVTTMIGWCQDDLAYFTDTNITTAQQTHDFVEAYVPTMTSDNVDKLLALYPIADFPANEAANKSSEFYRTARIWRDILMTCQPMWFAENIARLGNDVYLYDWNQTILDDIFKNLYNETGFGVVHGSEISYIFGNLTPYTPYFDPPAEDYALASRGSRSWSTFASTGKPGLEGHDTFQGFTPAFSADGEVSVFVVGGPDEGLSAIDGPNAKVAITQQKLRERCAFLNLDELIDQLRY